MKYITFQPYSVGTVLKKKDYSLKESLYTEIKDEFGYNPIFFIPLKNKIDFFIRNFLTSPSCIEVIIITELNKVDKINTPKWFEVKGKEKCHDHIKLSVLENDEFECISNKIPQRKVCKIMSAGDFVTDYISSPGFDNGQLNKYLMYDKGFWEMLDAFFEEKDEKDMVDFLTSKQLMYIIRDFSEIMSRQHDQKRTIDWFRSNIQNLDKTYKWK